MKRDKKWGGGWEKEERIGVKGRRGGEGKGRTRGRRPPQQNLRSATGYYIN